MIASERMWHELSATLQAAGSASAKLWSELVAAYAEPWRHYHTMDHIGALLALRRQHAGLFRNQVAVDLAIFLHDVVYEPRRSDNEAASAAWARSRLPALACSPDLVDMVACAIEMSRHDAASLAAVDPASDLALFLDLDLSILAADAPIYTAYTQAIRHEYAIYPDLIYRPGRAKVLHGFLARPAIYCSPPFRAAWEARARTNIAAEIQALTT